jgi:ABC-type transport system involved in multi-copper enzyme maturation permease subunit
VVDPHRPASMSEDTQILAGIVQLYYIRLGVFFGCLGIFSRLIRGEMIERSLHFYLLSPVRRELLLLSKFAAGSISALLLFGTAITADFVLIYAGFGAAGRDYVFHGPGLSAWGAYLAIVILACLGYGAIFLLLSMMFRNPTPAALIVWAWEAINPILPSLLQRFSVVFYLHHLMPVSVAAQGFFALLTVQTEPVSGRASTLGLLLLIVVVLFYSCYRMRTLEIRYTTE